MLQYSYCRNFITKDCFFSCKDGEIQPCVDGEDVKTLKMTNGDHEFLSFLLILMLTLVVMSTLAIVGVYYGKRWQRRTRFFAHARLNENVEEITNPIFDFTATERDDIALPITNISNNDDKVRILLVQQDSL